MEKQIEEQPEEHEQPPLIKKSITNPVVRKRANKKYYETHHDEHLDKMKGYMKTYYLLNKERLNKRRTEYNHLKKQKLTIEV